MYYHYAYELTIESEIEIPEFPAIEPVDAVDVRINLGEVPVELPGSPRRYSTWQGLPQKFLMDVAETGRYYVRDGNKITIQPIANADVQLVVVHLVSSIFAALLQQRGLLPLHAGSIVGPTGAVAFVGPSGIGKSTITSALLQRGNAMISDDVTALRKRSDGVFEAIPAMPRTRLWKDSVSKTGRNSGEGRPVRTQIEKLSLPVDNFTATAVNISHIFVLSTGSVESPKLEELSSAQALLLARQYTFRKKFQHAMSMDAEHFRSINELIAQVNFSKIVRPVAKYQLDEMCGLISSAIEA